MAFKENFVPVGKQPKNYSFAEVRHRIDDLI